MVRLVLVLILIGWKTGANLLSQSLSLAIAIKLLLSTVIWKLLYSSDRVFCLIFFICLWHWWCVVSWYHTVHVHAYAIKVCNKSLIDKTIKRLQCMLVKRSPFGSFRKAGQHANQLDTAGGGLRSNNTLRSSIITWVLIMAAACALLWPAMSKQLLHRNNFFIGTRARFTVNIREQDKSRISYCVGNVPSRTVQ